MNQRTTISLVMPYHDNPRMLLRQYENLAALPRYIRNHIELVICDDCSTELPPAPPPGLLMRVSIFRINGKHIPWSHRCATNIAAHESIGGFVLITDIDHVVPLDTWHALLMDPWLMFNRDRVYTFTRKNTDGKYYKPHPDSWFMRRDTWERIGGYDERYRGHYGQNAAFMDRVAHAAGPSILFANPLIRYSRDDIHDASERVLQRKLPADRGAIAHMRQKFKNNGTYFDRHALTASYHRVV